MDHNLIIYNLVRSRKTSYRFQFLFSHQFQICTFHSMKVTVTLSTSHSIQKINENEKFERSFKKGHVTFSHDATSDYVSYARICFMQQYFALCSAVAEIGEIGTRKPFSSALELRGLSRGRPAIWTLRSRHILAASGHVRENLEKNARFEKS